jgi:hypothetical protein
VGEVAVGERRGWSARSRAGGWALGLTASSITALLLLVLSFATGLVESAEGFTDNWLLTGWAVAILAASVGGLVTGGYAIARRHDSSWGVRAATSAGLLTTAVMLNEVAQGLAA